MLDLPCRNAGLSLVAALTLAMTTASPASALSDYENALGNDNDIFITANGSIFEGIDYTNAGDASGASDWEINTDNLPFASFGGGTKSLQGFAEGDNNRAKLGWDGANPFEFFSIQLRTRFAEDNGGSGLVDNNTDGVDDRWLTTVDVRFRDVNNIESVVSVLLDDGVTNDWVELDAVDVLAAADLGFDIGMVKAMFFEGDSGTTVGGGFKNDRFSIDAFDFAIVPEPTTALLLGLGLIALGGGRRRA